MDIFEVGVMKIYNSDLKRSPSFIYKLYNRNIKYLKYKYRYKISDLKR